MDNKKTKLRAGSIPKDRKQHKKSVALSRYKRRLMKHVWLVRFGGIIAVLLVVFLLAQVFFPSIKKSEPYYYYDLGKRFVSPDRYPVNQTDGRTNILILGKGGTTHDAPDLTDTIMLVSIDHEKDHVSLISIPRDIWITEFRAKVNSVYYWGNEKADGGGIILARDVAHDVVGVPIHYAAVVDFDGFNRVIDTLGGVEVDVATGFTDNRYPIAGLENDECDGDLNYDCRYETITFEKGLQYMDSETALKFVRSRNAEGDEGTDLARSARQQLVIEGIQKKVISSEIIRSPSKLRDLFYVVRGSIETDIADPEAAVLARYLYDGRENMSSDVIPEKLLVNPPPSATYDNLYVFIPANSFPAEPGQEWNEIHGWVKCKLDRGC